MMASGGVAVSLMAGGGVAVSLMTGDGVAVVSLIPGGGVAVSLTPDEADGRPMAVALMWVVGSAPLAAVGFAVGGDRAERRWVVGRELDSD